jgi:hypothetical protein
MAKQVQLRRGTTSEHSTFTGAVGEVTVDTTKDTLVVHDGSTTGGIPLARQSSVDLKAPIASPVFTGDLRADRLLAYGSGNISTNAAVGQFSLDNNTTGDSNTGVGYATLHPNITGGSNTALGVNALRYKQNWSNNTDLSYCTGVGSGTRVGGNNATAIGYNASAPASCVALGTSNERTLVGGAVDNGTDALQVNGSVKAYNTSNYNHINLGGGSELLQKSIFINLHPNALYMFRIYFSGSYVINSSFTVSTSNRSYGALITNFKNGTYLGDSTYITVKNHLGEDHTNCTSNTGAYNGVNYVEGIELTFNSDISGSYYMRCIEIAKSSYAVDQIMITTANAPATVVKTFDF